MSQDTKRTDLKHLFMAILYSFCTILLAGEYLPKIYINEFMASNSATILSDDYEEYTDWLEIYSAEDTSVSISGFFLTDDYSEPQKWQIPSGTRIAPGQSILFWADGQDLGLHTNFKLSAEGEEIGLFTHDGAVIDSLHYTAQIFDVSCGRYPDGDENLVFFDKPTPGTSNINPGFAGIVPDPVFLTEAGFYTGSHSIEISKNDFFETIRYTLDGSSPNTTSPICIAPIEINSTTVFRARSFRENYLPSKAVTSTYFIDETTTLPVVSVVTEPDNLWSDETGIYVQGTNGITGHCMTEPCNWNQVWERPVSLEMYEADREFGFKVDAGMRIGGGCTRKYPEKTLAIYLRKKYGSSKINYQIFKDKPIYRFNNILLRNSGQDWWRGMFRDGMMQTLVAKQMDIDWQAYKPAIVFLNGDYWGIHGIREKHNEHYLESNYGIDPDAIDILSGNGSVKQGTSENYNEMIHFIETHNLAVSSCYNYVASQMDINEYLNYMISEIYFANIDWPRGNIKYWRQQGEDHKWRWILFDTDLGFGAHGMGQYNSNTLANVTSAIGTYYANPPSSTFLFRNLLKNTDFRNEFIQRSAGFMNTIFTPERILAVIDSLKSLIEPEIPRHIQKWEQSTSFNSGWSYHVNVMNEFTVERPQYMLDHLIEKFDLNGAARLDVTYSNPGMGNVILSGVEMPDTNFSGNYLQDIPIRCVAAAKRGYRFAGWQGASYSLNDTIDIVLTQDSDLEALFEIDGTEIFYGLRINEVLASNSGTSSDEHNEYDDWIELYNDSREAIDIGGMYLTDDFDELDMWQIPISCPDSTTIQPGGFLVLWADKDTEQGILHLDLKLSGDGEAVGLTEMIDNDLTLIDTMTFGSQTTDVSYGRSPDGGNDLAYFSVPSPAYANAVTGISENKTHLPENMFLAQNYPNPFNPVTNISYVVSQDSPVKLNIYDISGHKVESLFDGFRQAGKYSIKWNASAFSTGVYIYQLESSDGIYTRKMLLIK